MKTTGQPGHFRLFIGKSATIIFANSFIRLMKWNKNVAMLTSKTGKVTFFPS
jgi:hypothetical protein